MIRYVKQLFAIFGTASEARQRIDSQIITFSLYVWLFFGSGYYIAEFVGSLYGKGRFENLCKLISYLSASLLTIFIARYRRRSINQYYKNNYLDIL